MQALKIFNKFIPEYVYTTMNGFLESYFLGFFFFLQAYRNTIDFCILISYSMTLLNSLTGSNSSFEDSLEFSTYMFTLFTKR